MPAFANHQDTAAREHRRKFRIGGKADQLRLATALKTLEALEEPLLLALDRAGCGAPTKCLLEMRCALRLLVEGKS